MKFSSPEWGAGGVEGGGASPLGPWLHHAWELCSNEGLLCALWREAEGEGEGDGCTTNRTGFKKKKKKKNHPQRATSPAQRKRWPASPPPLLWLLNTHILHAVISREAFPGRKS